MFIALKSQKLYLILIMFKLEVLIAQYFVLLHFFSGSAIVTPLNSDKWLVNAYACFPVLWV